MSASQDEGADNKETADVLSVKQLNERLIASENQNKQLKELLVLNLNLIEQLNATIARKDKLNKILREGYDSIKALQNKEQRLNLPPPSLPPVELPVLHLPELPTDEGKTIEPNQNEFEFLKEFQIRSIVFRDPNVTVPSILESTKPNQLTLLTVNNSNAFLIDNSLIQTRPIVYNDPNITVPSILESTKPNQLCEFEGVDSKPSVLVEEAVKPEPIYEISPICNNPIVKKIQKQNIKTAIERVDYEPKSVPKVNTELSNVLEDYDYFGVNRKDGWIKTYAKTTKATTCTVTNTTRTKSDTQTGSDTYQIMDMTPLGVDNNTFQHKAEMRVQSPIPKLTLKKTNRGCMKILEQPVRRMQDTDSQSIIAKDAAQGKNKRELNSLGDMVISNMDSKKCQDFTPPELSRNFEDSKVASQKTIAEKSNKRKRKKKHPIGTSSSQVSKSGKRGKDGKGAKPDIRKLRKKSAASTRTTVSEYHTYVEDPDVSRFYTLDSTKNDEPTVVEVPKWRIKEYSPIYSPEGTENLDDKVFAKRHQKFEAKERQQLRWHLREVREQRRLEKLKKRQSKNPGPSVAPTRSEHTVRPLHSDIRFIDITDTLPVTAFGQGVPDLPEEPFSLPWVRTSDALKKSKRYNTRQD